MDEVRSLAAMLRQSIELCTDLGDALRAFSDDMRDRRLLRAEERANKLPMKMVGPLGLLISRHCDAAGDHPADHRDTITLTSHSSATAEF